MEPVLEQSATNTAANRPTYLAPYTDNHRFLLIDWIILSPAPAELISKRLVVLIFNI
jgi:hypothetical protein